MERYSFGGYGSEYVFNNPDTKTRYQDVRKRCKSLLGAAGIENFRFHDLRHSFATRAGADPSVPVIALADVLGHKNLRTTMRYAHATEDDKRRVSEVQEKVG